MAEAGTVLDKAAELIEELRAKYRHQSGHAEQLTGLDASFEELDASLSQISPRELEIKKRVCSTLVDGVEKAKRATERASEIVVKISRHRNLLLGTPQQWDRESLTGIKATEETIAQLERECAETQSAINSDLEKLRQDKLRIDEEFKKLAAELKAVHHRNLSTSQDSFNSAMQQIQEMKDHGLCQLRLRSLESKGSQTIQRLEAEIAAARDRIKATRRLVLMQDKETLLARFRTQAAEFRASIRETKKTPEYGRAVVESMDGAGLAVTPKRPRRTLFQEEVEELDAQENNVIPTLEGDQLEAYLKSLKALIDVHRSRRPAETEVLRTST